MIRRRTGGVSAIYTVEDEKKKEDRVKRKEGIESAEKERRRLLRENYRSNRNTAVAISEWVDIHEKSLPTAEQMSERLSSLHGYLREVFTAYPEVSGSPDGEEAHALSEARIMRDIYQQRENVEWERRARREMDNANLREKNRRLQAEREDERVRLAKRQLSIHISDAKSPNSENGMFVRTGMREPVSEVKEETNRNKQEIILGMSIVGVILAIVAACIAFN